MKFAVMGMVTLACGAALAIDSEVWKDYLAVPVLFRSVPRTRIFLI